MVECCLQLEEEEDCRKNSRKDKKTFFSSVGLCKYQTVVSLREKEMKVELCKSSTEKLSFDDFVE